jgi:hypothetical protein
MAETPRYYRHRVVAAFAGQFVFLAAAANVHAQEPQGVIAGQGGAEPVVAEPVVVEQAIVVQEAVPLMQIEAGQALIVDGVGNRRNVAADRKQLAKDLQPILASELYFLMMVTEIKDPDKRIAISDAAAVQMDNLGELLVKENAFGGMGMGFGGGEVVAQTASGLSLNANPYRRIRELIATAAEPILSDQQMQIYRHELDKRNAYHQASAVGMIVNLLDQHLALSVTQRDAIFDSLNDNWPAAVDVSLDMYQSNPTYIPQIPFPLIDKYLNRSQRTVWKTLNQYRFPMQLNMLPVAIDWGND